MSRFEKTLKELNSREYDVLKSIYDYRCLTPEQVYILHYKYNERTGKVVSDTYSKARIRIMKQLGAIKSERFFDSEVLFLTNHGIEVLKRIHELPSMIYDEKTKKVKKGYLTAKDLELNSKMFNHQISLNEFVIDFSLNNPDINYTYKDEKDINQYVGIRPDGLLSIDNVDLFLEMDMSTESKKQLDDKWSGYREFLNSNEHQLSNRKLIMLFIIESSAKDREKDEVLLKNKIQERKKVVKNRIMESLFDLIGERFDIYVGSHEEMISLINEKIITQPKSTPSQRAQRIINALHCKHRFNHRDYQEHFSKRNSINSKFTFDSYIYKFKEIKPDLYALQKDSEGRGIEFLIDDYLYDPVSVMVKIFYYRSYNTSFKEKHRRNIRYIVIVDEFKDVYNDLKLYNLIEDLDNIYFTTLDRLENLPFHKALCYITSIGNVYSYKDSDLKYPKLELSL